MLETKSGKLRRLRSGTWRFIPNGYVSYEVNAEAIVETRH